MTRTIPAVGSNQHDPLAVRWFFTLLLALMGGVLYLFSSYFSDFLLALLLPAVLHRTARGPGGAWPPRAGKAEVVREVLGVVTAFTLAHSITLALGSFIALGGIIAGAVLGLRYQLWRIERQAEAPPPRAHSAASSTP